MQCQYVNVFPSLLNASLVSFVSFVSFYSFFIHFLSHLYSFVSCYVETMLNRRRAPMRPSARAVGDLGHLRCDQVCSMCDQLRCVTLCDCWSTGRALYRKKIAAADLLSWLIWHNVENSWAMLSGFLAKKFTRSSCRGEEKHLLYMYFFEPPSWARIAFWHIGTVTLSLTQPEDASAISAGHLCKIMSGDSCIVLYSCSFHFIPSSIRLHAGEVHLCRCVHIALYCRWRMHARQWTGHHAWISP